jgi:hypothetical protein
MVEGSASVGGDDLIAFLNYNGVWQSLWFRPAKAKRRDDLRVVQPLDDPRQAWHCDACSITVIDSSVAAPD